METGSSFSDLDWRLDVQIASRNSRSLVNPTFILQLETEKDGEKSSQILQTDYTNLKHLCHELETALDTYKQTYARRVARNI
jgi:hypothetical protein